MRLPSYPNRDGDLDVGIDFEAGDPLGPWRSRFKGTLTLRLGQLADGVRPQSWCRAMLH